MTKKFSWDITDNISLMYCDENSMATLIVSDTEGRRGGIITALSERNLMDLRSAIEELLKILPTDP